MPEAESELVAGYHTEYSSMKFAMFFLAEYSNMLTSSALIVTFFFGGWDIPFWSGDNIGVAADGAVVGATPAWWITLLTAGAFMTKTALLVFVFMWVRWTVPRFRYDQVMALGWKVLIPLIVVYIVVLGAVMLVLDGRGVEFGLTYGLVLTGLNLALLMGLLFLLDRSRIIAGAGWRQKRPKAALERG